MGHVGKVLTDKQIRKYELEGRYGPEAQARALAKVPKKRQKKIKESLLKRALRELTKGKE
jgi:hypothetical protein